MANAAFHFFIAGHVQGVGFRWATCQLAEELQLAGYVRNRTDGRVEVWAEGDSADLAELAHWLETGPEGAHVDAVSKQKVEFKGYNGFHEMMTI
ncbi:acylphosphatase [Chitinibacter sp. SCUT-21]|uniref:acylphosphatase n=1 Tax=Chitinibacter sp. SCUT-21 TaxID=2970891 RepID=UPI0035A681C3